MSKRKPQLIDYINMAINENYMIWILVTSGAEGKLSTMGFDYGVGKSTFALQYMRTTCYAGNWAMVRKNTIGAYWQIKPILDRPHPTNACYIDEMELTLGKHQQHNKAIQELAYYMKTVRPYCHVWFASAPSRDTLQKDFREMFHFEVIIVKRGLYEVQQLKRWLDFKKPQKLKETLRYSAEFSFFDLPPPEKKWYEGWRHDMNVKIRNTLKAFSGMVDGELKIQHLSEAETTLVKDIASKGFIRYETLHDKNLSHIANRLKRKGWLELDSGRRYMLTENAEATIYD